MKQVSFNELGEQFINVELFGALRPENFERFIKYSEHPDVQEKVRYKVMASFVL